MLSGNHNPPWFTLYLTIITNNPPAPTPTPWKNSSYQKNLSVFNLFHLVLLEWFVVIMLNPLMWWSPGQMGVGGAGRIYKTVKNLLYTLFHCVLSTLWSLGHFWLIFNKFLWKIIFLLYLNFVQKYFSKFNLKIIFWL